MLFAAMLTVNSPMVTLALLEETKADGPVARTTLGVVLVADVVVILLFTAAFSLARASLEGGSVGGGAVGAGEILAQLLGEVSGSILAGAVVGGVLTLYLRFVRRELVVFAIVVVFAAAAAAQALGFELLLSLLVAGFLVENVAPVRAEPLVDTLHQMAVPVFVVFFAMAGAELRVQEFAAIWPFVLTVAVVRIGAIFVGARLGARLARAEPVVERYAWMGLVSQAGAALGLASLVADRLPVVGLAMQTATIGVIALNTSLGSVLFRRGLDRAGEIVMG